MSLLWHFYWPVVLAALVVGILAGRSGFRQRKLTDDASREQIADADREYERRKKKTMAVGFAAMLAIAGLWHWPLGGSTRFANRVETVVADEMRRVGTPEYSARLARGPLSRTIIVSGSANPFQKDGFVRLLREVPGVARVRWADEPRGFDLPLLFEVVLLCFASFALGLFFSWIVEIRRRVNAHWKW